MIFKRKQENPDITVQERGQENRRAVENLLKEIAKKTGENMDNWQRELKELHNG